MKNPPTLIDGLLGESLMASKAAAVLFIAAVLALSIIYVGANSSANEPEHLGNPECVVLADGRKFCNKGTAR